MGRAVAERTILRPGENWADVAHRVAQGNSLLCRDAVEAAREYALMRRHISKATMLMSGRHLQHGDDTQPSRSMEVFTNCSTSAASFVSFYLLLAGSGVGRCYDDDMILIDWDHAPNLRCVLSHNHPDFDWSAHESWRDALHKYGPESKSVMWFKVPDSREGWAQALEVWENAAFEKIHKDKMLILDFSDVRSKGSPIAGMQGRPASGPVPLMNAFAKAASLRGSSLPPWKQAMYVDHYFSECVLVGGARRAARMSTKFWKDPTVVDFVRIKRPIEFHGKSVEEVAEHRRSTPGSYGFLWSSNNSVTVDAEFWDLLDARRKDPRWNSRDARHARRVWKEVVACAYGDGTGEPGLINVDKLVRNDEGWEALSRRPYVGSRRYQVREDTELLLSRLAKRAQKKKYNMITNPCGEVNLTTLGGFCVIGDVVPFHADSLEEAEEAIRTTVRALIRVNTMDSLYREEVLRTNRIGVSITGVHEFAWKFFRVGFKDLIDPDLDGLAQLLEDIKTAGMDEKFELQYLMGTDVEHLARTRSALFWLALRRFSSAAKDEAEKYSKKLGLNTPHTVMCVKPSGSVSKLFGLTEGWHLPSMRFYMRWVQFRNDDPLVQVYEKRGYPVRHLRTYEGTTVVGFPTAPVISTLEMGDALVTASEATPEEQYKWVTLGEQFWIVGEGEDRGSQISYTLKYDPAVVDHKHFADMLRRYQRTVRCCSVMPQDDSASYEYTPEQAVTKAEYEEVYRKIEAMEEQVDKAHVDCASGACPIDFKERALA